MQSGIEIKCKKRFGQFLLTENPSCIINDVETKQLEWYKEIFIPLQPNVPHKITVQFPYMGGTRGIASINTQVNPGEIQVYEYTTPKVMFSPGTIKLKSTRHAPPPTAPSEIPPPPVAESPTTNIKHCRNCGSPNSIENRFCMKCGSKFG